MLLRFSVENHLCFGPPVCLDLCPKGSKTATENSDNKPPGPSSLSGPSDPIEPVGSNSPPRIVLISGPAASGKSALLRSMGLLRNLVLAGPRAPLAVLPQRFYPAGPTRLSIDVQIEAAVFSYALVLSPQQILEESLRITPAARDPAVSTRTLFSRRAGDPGRPPIVEAIDLPASEQGRLRLLAQSTRAEQPLVNEGLRRGLPLFVPFGVWLRDHLQLLLPEAKFVGLAARAARDPALLDFLGDYLSIADLGIRSLSVVREPVPSGYFQNQEELDEVTTELTRFPDSFAETPEGELIAQPAKNGPFVDIERVRLLQTLAGPDGRTAELAIDELPETGRRLLHLSPLFYSAGAAGPPAPCALIDDVGHSLSPRLLSALLSRFALDADLPAGRQLIGFVKDAPEGEEGCGLGRSLLANLRRQAPQAAAQHWVLNRTSAGSQLTVVV